MSPSALHVLLLTSEAVEPYVTGVTDCVLMRGAWRLLPPSSAPVGPALILGVLLSLRECLLGSSGSRDL